MMRYRRFIAAGYSYQAGVLWNAQVQAARADAVAACGGHILPDGEAQTEAVLPTRPAMMALIRKGAGVLHELSLRDVRYFAGAILPMIYFEHSRTGTLLFHLGMWKGH